MRSSARSLSTREPESMISSSKIALCAHQFSGVSGKTLPISSDYHHRQAATLTRLAQTTRDPDTAKALLRIAADHIARAEEAAQTTPLVELVVLDKHPE